MVDFKEMFTGWHYFKENIFSSVAIRGTGYFILLLNSAMNAILPK